MKFKDNNGREKVIKAAWKYRVNWEKKCRSKFQKRIKDWLRNYWEKDMLYEEFPVVGTKMTLDFYNASKKIAVEVQGEAHFQYSSFFHNGSRQKFLGQMKRDMDKVKYCKLNNIQLIEIYPDTVLDESLFLEKEEK